MESRLWIGRNSSTCGTMVRMPLALASKPEKRSSGLSQISRRQERCSRSISKASRSSGSRSSPSVISSTIAPWVSTRRAQSLLKACSEVAMRVPPDQSATFAADRGQRLVRILGLERTGDVGQTRPEQERVDALARIGHRVEEMQEQPRVLAHGAGNIEQRDDRRRLGAGSEIFEIDDRAAGLQACAQRAAHVDAMTVTVGAQDAASSPRRATAPDA